MLPCPRPHSTLTMIQLLTLPDVMCLFERNISQVANDNISTKNYARKAASFHKDSVAVPKHICGASLKQSGI